MRRVQLIDLDGCTADDRWRRKYIRPAPEGLTRGGDPEGWAARFNRYHQLAWQDDAANSEHLLPGCEYAVLTGRPAEFRAETYSWVRIILGIDPLCILHRANHDTRRSVDVKRVMLYQLMDPNSWGIRREEIVGAIDDVADIVEMYRSEGISNAQIVRIGEEEHING